MLGAQNLGLAKVVLAGRTTRPVIDKTHVKQWLTLQANGGYVFYQCAN